MNWQVGTPSSKKPLLLTYETYLIKTIDGFYPEGSLTNLKLALKNDVLYKIVHSKVTIETAMPLAEDQGKVTLSIRKVMPFEVLT
jgi:hypothetical protein